MLALQMSFDRVLNFRNAHYFLNFKLFVVDVSCVLAGLKLNEYNYSRVCVCGIKIINK